MNKHVICALLAVILAAAVIGCGGKGDGYGTTITNGTNKAPAQVTGTDISESVNNQGDSTNTSIPPVSTSGTTAATGGVIELKPDEDGVVYKDKDTVIIVATNGTTYINGRPATPEEVLAEVGITSAPKVTTPEITTKVPDTDSVDIESTNNSGTTIPDDVFSLGKYNDSGNTALSITTIDVYSNSDPGVKGLVNFDAGTLLLVNYWCDTTAAPLGDVYFVSADVEHKGSYSESEYAAKAKMFQGFVTGGGQFFVEVQLPANMTPGEYELRFCYGGEEEGFARYIVE